MTHKRNTEAVTQKAKQKSIEATKKAETAISELIKANENISVAKVAERAGVSRQWIYKNESMLGRIKRLSEQQSGKPKTPPKRPPIINFFSPTLSLMHFCNSKTVSGSQNLLANASVLNVLYSFN